MSPDHKAKIGAANRRLFEESQDLELLAKMTEMYERGTPCEQIAKEVGKGAMTVWRWLKRAGVEVKAGALVKGKHWSDARRVHHPAKPERPADAPRGYEIVVQRALGNKSISTDGYVLVNLGHGERQYEHILVAEKAIGRKLRRGEVVHHINFVRHDNRNENLLVCSIAYHLQLHARMRLIPYWIEVEANYLKAA